MNNGESANADRRRALTEEDVAFLSKLGRDMAEGPTLGQCAPRYWVIRDYDYRPAVEGFDDIDRVWYASDHYDLDEIARLCYEDILHEAELDADDDADCERRVRREMQGLGLAFDEAGELMRDDFFEIEEATLRGLHVSKWDDDQPVYETLCAKFSDGPIFLTLADAEAHLDANHYHYHPDAHPYALTAWRSPRIERLFEILTEVDFEGLL